MANRPSKAPHRLSVPPPGTLAFADGGAVRPETADELMARIAGKYGVSGQAQAAPVQQAAQQPKPAAQQRPEAQGITTGIIGLIKQRQQQIDEAAKGYSNGGKISGPGTPTSDSIPATVHETGEPIKVSTGERIVSVEQGKFLESVAKNAGYESLDAMLEDGTGKPVGPVLKGGKRAAADGMNIDSDPFAYRGDKPIVGPAAGITVVPGAEDRVTAAIAAPPTLGGTPLARSEPAGTLTGPASGLTIKPGRNEQGIITDDSAKDVVGADMQRTGGVFGTMDMKGVNDILARENKARGEMIDLSIAANGGNGVAVLGDGGVEAANAEKTARWRQDDLIDKASRGNSGPIAAAIHANASGDAEDKRNEIAIRGQDLGYGAKMAAQGLTARGQELGLQKAHERNDVLTRGQDIRADTADKRTEAITERRGQPTLSQERSNAEIDAARERIAGMDATEIKRRTANYTATGRENPDFDPTLAKAVTLANRRKIGDDQHFDERQQLRQPAGSDGDVMTRFKADQAMQGHKLGNPTPNGVEVLDSSGKVIGHYK